MVSSLTCISFALRAQSEALTDRLQNHLRREGSGVDDGWLRSKPNSGFLYVPSMWTGTTSPCGFFLKNGSITFNISDFSPLEVLEIFVSTRIDPCKLIL